ncbi:MAG: ABC transporter [Planctomycetales bacterium 4484_113]|nr:MAG: ABC transporter [Planctomycetales bacterium 4484_113]
MGRAWTIYKKELKSYYESPIAYIFMVVFLAVAVWVFFRGFFLIGEVSLRGLFGIIPWLCLFFIPAISMRLWAEERKTGTNELLFSLPVEEWEVVLGKYLAALLVYTVTLLLTLPVAICVSFLGNLDWGVAIGSYVGALFLGAAVLSIGTFVSSLTTNQIVAFILGVIVVAGLMIVGEPIVTMFIPSSLPWLVPYAQYLGLAQHFSSIARGVLDTRDFIYYLLLIVFPLYLTINAIRARKVG